MIYTPVQYLLSAVPFLIAYVGMLYWIKTSVELKESWSLLGIFGCLWCFTFQMFISGAICRAFLMEMFTSPDVIWELLDFAITTVSVVFGGVFTFTLWTITLIFLAIWMKISRCLPRT